MAAVRNGHARPRPGTRIAYTACCGAFAKKRLREAGLKPPSDDVAACRMYLAGYGHWLDPPGNGPPFDTPPVDPPPA